MFTYPCLHNLVKSEILVAKSELEQKSRARSFWPSVSVNSTLIFDALEIITQGSDEEGKSHDRLKMQE